MKSFLLFLLIFITNDLYGLHFNVDMTPGTKKILTEFPIAKIEIRTPFKETRYFIYDSLKNNTLYITQILETSFEEYGYPYYCEGVYQGDVIQIGDLKFRINSWDRMHLYYEVLDDSTIMGKKLKPSSFNPVTVNYYNLENEEDTSEELIIGQELSDEELSGLVKSKANSSYLFVDLNKIYPKALKFFRDQKYQESLDLFKEILYRKNIQFYGLVYIAALNELKLNNYENSLEYFNQLLELIPNNPLGLYGIALVYYYLENTINAEFNARRLVKSFPDYKPGAILRDNIKNRIDRSKLDYFFPKDIYKLSVEELSKDD